MSEASRIVEMLEDRMLSDAPSSITAGSTTRALLWCLFHPFKAYEEFGRFYALRDAVDAIESGEHLRDQNA